MNESVQLLARLVEAHVEFVIVGGTAAVLHGSAMATYDLDILMRFTLANSEGLLKAVSDLHPRLSHTPDKRPLTLAAGALTTYKNLYLLTDLGRLDVLGSLPPVDANLAFQTSALVDVGGVRVRVLSLALLIEVKAAMGRPKDKQTEVELRAINDVLKSQS